MIPSVADARAELSAAVRDLDEAEAAALTSGDLEPVEKACARKARAETVLRLAVRRQEEDEKREAAARRADLAAELETLRAFVTAGCFVDAIRPALDRILEAEAAIQSAAAEIAEAMAEHNDRAERAIDIGRDIGEHVDARTIANDWPAFLAGALVAERFEVPIGSLWLRPVTRPRWDDTDNHARWAEARELLGSAEQSAEQA